MFVLEELCVELFLYTFIFASLLKCVISGISSLYFGVKNGLLFLQKLNLWIGQLFVIMVVDTLDPSIVFHGLVFFVLIQIGEYISISPSCRCRHSFVILAVQILNTLIFSLDLQQLLLVCLLLLHSFNLVKFHFLKLLKPLLGLVSHCFDMYLLILVMLIIKPSCNFSGSTPERCLLHGYLIVVNIVNITGLDAMLLEKLSIVNSFFCLKLSLQLHLTELFGLDIFEHLGTLLLLLHFLFGTFAHVLGYLLNPLFIGHVQFNGWIQVNDGISSSDARDNSSS